MLGQRFLEWVRRGPAPGSAQPADPSSNTRGAVIFGPGNLMSRRSAQEHSPGAAGHSADSVESTSRLWRLSSTVSSIRCHARIQGRRPTLASFSAACLGEMRGSFDVVSLSRDRFLYLLPCQ